MGNQRRQPLSAALALGRRPRILEPRWEGGRLFWLEQRPGEGGRTTLLMRRHRDEAPLELTPGGWNLRSRVHEYGGGVWTVADATVVFVDDRDRCLWRLDLPADPLRTPLPDPVRLTPPLEPLPARGFADGLIDRPRRRWIGVMEQDGRDHLVTVPLSGGEPALLHQPEDFCGYGVLSPGGDHLAWVEWQGPFMPWERSELWLAAVEADGRLGWRRRIAGSNASDRRGISVFQPLWIREQDLVVASDRSGWWNLLCMEGAADLSSGGEDLPAWQPLLSREAEFALPQWTYGMRTTAWDGEQLLAAACHDGRWELGRIRPALGQGGGGWERFDLPFTDLEAVQAQDGRLVALAASPREAQGVLELETGSGRFHHTPTAACPLAAEAISLPEALWFEGHGGQRTHAWFTPPQRGAGAGAPLLVRGHSGPTGMARTGLDLVTQFWSSRGWGVLDVNYGGSTGFGRAYRERLDGCWGVADVEDCAAAARAVAAAGRADPARIAIEGSSASGFTVLAALCFTDVFRAGACRYGVADPAALAQQTHRFEARYLDHLIGPWPAARKRYEERSPLLHADRIRSPLILFQGLEDVVVPPAQTETMAMALKHSGVPVEVHLFPGEGHGFRSAEVRSRVLEATEAFFRRHFAL